MTEPRDLKEFLAEFLQVEIVPRPPDETWADMMQRISVPARIAEVDEETYEWFLECLPPRWMNGSSFAFAEGAEAFRLFWRRRPDGRFFVRQLTWPETVTFCRLARIPVPW